MSKNKVHFELYQNKDEGWITAATLTQIEGSRFDLEYDLDYAIANLDRADEGALSLAYPVQMQKYRDVLPGFVLDLIPQGDPLKRLLGRYEIGSEREIFTILSRVPLAPPGNIRVKEPWTEIDAMRGSYAHRGFTLSDILDHKEEFVEYMEETDAPVGGTSGVAGGSPKFLLREDQEGRFHADGLLANAKTKRALLVKFPYTDSQNSAELSHLEKQYYDLIQDLSLHSGPPMEIHDDILFITRFDRNFEGRDAEFYGLESLYSAHDVNVHGRRLYHEENLELIARSTAEPIANALEYIKRDILSRALSNTDNHGRNTSLLKAHGKVRLSPIYDLTSMRFFKGEIITELTKWRPENEAMADRVALVSRIFRVEIEAVLDELRSFYLSIKDLDERMRAVGIKAEWIARTTEDRTNALEHLKTILD